MNLSKNICFLMKASSLISDVNCLNELIRWRSVFCFILRSRKANLSSQTWSMAFHVLSCVANQTLPEGEGFHIHPEFNQDQAASWRTLLRDRNLSGALFKFLSFVPSYGGSDSGELTVSPLFRFFSLFPLSLLVLPWFRLKDSFPSRYF